MIPAGATVLWLILALAFLLITLFVRFLDWRKKRKDAYEKAKKDLDEAVNARDWNAIDDAHRRLHKNK